MTNGLRTWDPNTGEITFDSPNDLVLFPKTERLISGNSEVGNGAGITITYPQFVGKKIIAFMTSPYGTYGSVDGFSVLSCTWGYTNGIPYVHVFVDNNVSTTPLGGGSSMSICDGYLIVMLTGANQ